MISTNLTQAQLLGFVAATIADELRDCDITICQQHFHPARPLNPLCCPCSCRDRGGFTLVSWIDKVELNLNRRAGMRCSCLSTVTVGFQLSTCWPTATKCDSREQRDTVDRLLAASQCLTELLCCGNLLEALSEDATISCDAVEPSELSFIKDCDRMEIMEGERETCCTAIEWYVRIK